MKCNSPHWKLLDVSIKVISSSAENSRKIIVQYYVLNISAKWASELIWHDIYMCELGRFFRFTLPGYLGTKFLILMETETIFVRYRG